MKHGLPYDEPPRSIEDSRDCFVRLTCTERALLELESRPGSLRAVEFIKRRRYLIIYIEIEKATWGVK